MRPHEHIQYLVMKKFWAGTYEGQADRQRGGLPPQLNSHPRK
jgi:hypothetical protein